MNTAFVSIADIVNAQFQILDALSPGYVIVWFGDIHTIEDAANARVLEALFRRIPCLHARLVENSTKLIVWDKRECCLLPKREAESPIIDVDELFTLCYYPE